MVDINGFQKKRVENIRAIAHMMGERARYFELDIDATNISFVFYQGASGNYNVDIKYYVFETPI